MTRLEKKALLQKILAVVCVGTGLGLTLTGALAFNEILLAIGIPVLVAGVGVVGAILDPRQRYVFNLNNVQLGRNSDSPTSASRRLVNALTSMGYRVSRPGMGAGVSGGSEDSSPPVTFSSSASSFHTARDEDDEYALSDTVFDTWAEERARARSDSSGSSTSIDSDRPRYARWFYI